MSKREKIWLFCLLNFIYVKLVLTADASVPAMLLAMIIFGICGALFIGEE